MLVEKSRNINKEKNDEQRRRMRNLIEKTEIHSRKKVEIWYWEISTYYKKGEPENQIMII